MIIFGTYRFSIQTLDPKDLPFSDRLQPGDSVRQLLRVFHVFWIPVFPLEKTWVLDTDDGRFDISKRMKNAELAHRIEPKATPWYSFSLLILVGLYFILSGIL